MLHVFQFFPIARIFSVCSATYVEFSACTLTMFLREQCIHMHISDHCDKVFEQI